MNVVQQNDTCTITTYHYRLTVRPDAWRLDDPRTGHCLLAVPTPLVLRPTLAGRSLAWRCTGIAATPAAAGSITLTLTGEVDAPELGALEVVVRCFPAHIELAAACPARENLRIAHWELLAPDTALNLFHLHHWRNRHGHTATYETYNLSQGGQSADAYPPAIPPEMVRQWTAGTAVSTFSTDFQFAPRPSLLFFQRDAVMLGIGSRDLPHGFGLECEAAGNTLRGMRYNYGGEHGLDYAAGETVSAPRTYLWLDHHRDIWECVDRYVELLQEDGMIPRRTLRDIPHWWRAPLYCTWNDQGYLANNPGYYNWPGEQPTGKSPVTAFDAAMLDHLLDVLERERYPVGAVIIDDGWEACRGQWEPHPARFPHLRAQIDRIHAMGLKAILWIAPFDVAPESAARRHPEWLAGGGVLNKWEMPLVDYSHPRTQEEFLQPLLRSFFSSDPDCLDADGLKLDFMADKIHPVFPIHDRAWRGEERFIQRTIHLINAEMKRIKPDAVMLGCTAHPAFIDCQDLVRTYDVPVSQSQHADRAVMIRHFNPGNLVSLDLCETKSLADVEEHLAIADRHNLLYELARIAPDPHTGEFCLGPEYRLLLHRKLAAWGVPKRA